MNEVETIKYVRNPYQLRVHEALKKNKRINAIGGGWRIGKTNYVAYDHIIARQLYDNPDVLHLICSNTYSQLYDATLRPLYDWLQRLSIPHRPETLPTSHKGFSIFCWSGEKWVEFLVRTAENIQTISGSTLGSAWLDEAHGVDKWVYDLINSRLSDKNSKHLQFVLTFNADEPEHWLHTDIIQAFDLDISRNGARSAREIVEYTHGTTFENKNNLAEGYIDSLSSTLDEQLYQRFILDKWISIGKGRIFYNFDREKHISKTELQYDKHLPLLISSDFNVDPMCWSIWQKHKDELWCIDELMVKGKADTETCCREIWNRYSDAKRIEWFGDASGESGTTKSIKSDYDIIRGFFSGKTEFAFSVTKSNPSIRDSANAVNSRLKNTKGESFILIDKKCVNLILSVEGSQYKNGTFEKDESGDRNPKAKVKTHFGDTVRYIVNTLYPIRFRKASDWSDSGGVGAER